MINIWLTIIITSIAIGSIWFGIATKRYTVVSYVAGCIIMGAFWYGKSINSLPLAALIFIVIGVFFSALVKYEKDE